MATLAKAATFNRQGLKRQQSTDGEQKSCNNQPAANKKSSRNSGNNQPATNKKMHQ